MAMHTGNDTTANPLPPAALSAAKADVPTNNSHPDVALPPQRSAAPGSRPDRARVDRQLANAFRAATAALAVTSPAGVLVQVNAALGALLGWPPDDLLGHRLDELAEAEHAQAVTAGRRELLAQTLSEHVQVTTLRHGRGHQVPVCLTSTLVGQPARSSSLDAVDPQAAGPEVPPADGPLLVVHVLDLSDRRATEADLTHRALHDPLTGLPNRVLLVDRLNVALSRLHRRPSAVAVLFLDLNEFKQVNDRYGHAAGDQVLAVVARRLQQLQRPGDTVCRYGGDEFAVLCTDSGRREADSVARRIQTSLTTPIQVLPFDDDSGRPLVVTLTACVGVATTTDPGSSAGQLLHDADIAMYSAKKPH